MPFNSKLHEYLYSLPEPYVASVIRAGGLPVLVPAVEDITGVLNRLDGIIFSGGADIQPSLYDGNHDHPKLLSPDVQRDSNEIPLMNAALKRPDLPILAICRGMQVLNVAMGGTLLEHLPDHIDADIHRNDEGLWTKHDVTISRGSLLSDIVRTPKVHTTSGHHQALGKIAAELSVVARAADKTVEAVEHISHPWCVAVQWHPERTSETDPTQQAIFDALIREASD